MCHTLLSYVTSARNEKLRQNTYQIGPKYNGGKSHEYEQNKQ